MTLPPSELIVTSPDGHIARYKLGEKAFIGRHPECEVILTDPMSSRRHCRIERDPDGRFYTQDNGSANGTLLNDQALKERMPFKNGDRIQIGSTLLVLRVESPIGAPATRQNYVPGMSIVSLVDEADDAAAPNVDFSQKADAGMLTDEERSTYDINRLKRVTERLKLLIDIGQAMGASLDPHKLLNSCLDKLFEVFSQADRGIIVLYGPDGSVPSQLTSEADQAGALDRRKGAITKVKLRSTIPGQAQDNEVKLSRTVLKRISTERASVLINESSGGSAGMSLAKFEIKSLMCAPLLTGKDDLGIIQLETKNRMRPFTSDDLSVLTAVAGQVAVVIRNAELALSAAAAAAQRESLSRFLSPQLVEEVLSEKLSIALGGVVKHSTVFFSDIVGFTKLARTMSPQNVAALLNRYFTVMQNIVYKRGGSIDKCAGDQIMAHWGVLGDLKDYTAHAVTAAVEMQVDLFNFNRAEAQRKEEGYKPVALGHGIGLSSGDVCAGNIGSERKIEFTVIGDPVNMSARIEAMAGRGQTFLGEPTFEEVKARAFCLRMPPCPAKNVDEPLPIFSVRGIVPPPDKKDEPDDPESWTLSDLLLCMPCTLQQADGTAVAGVVTGIHLMPGGAGKLEMHIEKFIAPSTRVKLDWNVAEKKSLPPLEGEVEACFPCADVPQAGMTTSQIARGRTAILAGRAVPGMLTLKVTEFPKLIADLRPGTLIDSDFKSHEEIIRV